MVPLSTVAVTIPSCIHFPSLDGEVCFRLHNVCKCYYCGGTGGGASPPSSGLDSIPMGLASTLSSATSPLSSGAVSTPTAA